ncbi:MAG: FAD-dependent oxidoreductase [Acidimicrobiia bacterium]|nr:FAD-dependent oxidoreductase [Acidimicrobiia bacterium]MDQ3501161.1 FAD-dependent oxidoreductase [Actinomycetota bacterium]
MWDKFPVIAEADVVIVGSGSAGSSAAIAAGRSGADAVLIEKLPFLGGTSTAVLDTFYGFFTPGNVSKKVVGGVGDDVVTGLKALGPVIRRPNTFGAGMGITYVAEHLKVVWERLVREAGVRVLLHTFLQHAIVNNGWVDEIVVATKAGLRRVRATVFVDASGDADLCHFAGFGYERAGDAGPVQTLTTTFRMANVDRARRASIDTKTLHGLMAEAASGGGYDLPRREGSDHITPIDGVTATIMTRLPSYERHADGTAVNATDPDFLTNAEMDGRRQALEYVRFLRDHTPGYESAQLVALGTQIGVRETRRVYGDYRLTAEDVLGAVSFDDQIGLCGAPIEDHHEGTDTRWRYLPDGATVGIPYRSLVVRDAGNVLVGGRCFSATHDAHASVRSMAQCMAMGQAAGAAAAMAVADGVSARDVDVHRLQSALSRGGAIIESDDAVVAP